MASTSNNVIEGQSINRPPFFDGNNYSYWKCRMTIYLKSTNFKLWDIIINDFPKNDKPYKDWNEEDERLATLDAKGLNILFCAVNQEQFNKISNYTTSQEAWHNLEVTHEGTN